MTMYEAKDRFARALEGWMGRLILSILMALSGTFAFNAWQTVTSTQMAVDNNGKSEARLEGKFDTLTSTIGQFQAAVLAQRAVDDAQTTAISNIKNDLVRLEQEFHDHVRNDAMEMTHPTR